MSTRLFVKNLPKHVTEDKLKAFFSQKGQVTDVKILKKKYACNCYSHIFSGVSRQIGFVGYKTEEEAKAALSFFNNSYYHTSKLSVSFAEAVGSFGVYNVLEGRSDFPSLEPIFEGQLCVQQTAS